MGSAAPSRRRFRSVVPFVVVGALVIALWPFWSGDDPERGSGSIDRAGGDELAAGVSVESRTVSPTPGWTVPTVEHSADHGVEGGGHDTSSTVPVGTETTGGTVDVPADRFAMIVTADSSVDLAYRFVGSIGPGEWHHLSDAADEAPDGSLDGSDPGNEGTAGGRPLARGPVVFGDDVSSVEFVTLAGPGQPFDVIFLGRGQGAVTDPAAPLAVPVDGDGSAPAIVPRSQWASADWDYGNNSCDDGPSVADHLLAVVVHHTVTDNNYSEQQVPDLLRAIHYSHVVVNGWCDIGYNFVVDRFGTIWEARTGSIDVPVVGGHAKGFNTGTVGVAMLGQHHASARPTATSPTTDAVDGVAAVARWKLERHGVDPAGMTWLRNRSSSEPLRLAPNAWHYVPTVLGHRDLGVTSCPGSLGIDVVRALPDRIAARRDVDPPYAFRVDRAHTHGHGFAVADAVGGLRPAGSAVGWGNAPAAADVDGQVIAVGAGHDGGYLLTATGALVAFGASPDQEGRPAGNAPVADIVVRPDGASGWVLDRSGRLQGFGGAGNLAPPAIVDGAVSAEVSAQGRGYIVDRNGLLHPIGGAAGVASVDVGGASVETVETVDLALSGTDRGWVLDTSGRLHGFGGASDHQVAARSEVVAVVAAENGPGGWVADRDGQLWPFGDAPLILPVSTNTSDGNIVDADGLGVVNRAAFLESEDAAFIGSAYRLLLGRTAEAAELDRSATRLEQGARRYELALELARSEHWAGANIERMYRDVLGRPPDAAGRGYWLDEVGGGLALQELGTYFYGSAEYAARAGSNDAYVSRLYQTLLGRPADPEGLNYWVGQLDQGLAGPPDVAAGFYASIESRRDRAAQLHAQALGEPPAEDELDPLADRLLAVGDVELMAELVASSDYYDRATAGGSS